MPPLDHHVVVQPAKRAFSLAREFRDFAFKGNIVDLAIGIILGTAFAKLIDALVKSVLMPVIAVVLPGDQSYTNWKFTVGAKEVPYGIFLGELVNFLIVAFALFVFVVKLLGWLRRMRQDEEAAQPPPTPRSEELLMEIRDLLRQGPPARSGA